MSWITLQSNPVARWHICQGSINAISFSPDGAYMATVGRDGTYFALDTISRFYPSYDPPVLSFTELFFTRFLLN
jgi:WD40 repeat protein